MDVGCFRERTKRLPSPLSGPRVAQPTQESRGRGRTPASPLTLRRRETDTESHFPFVRMSSSDTSLDPRSVVSGPPS